MANTSAKVLKAQTSEQLLSYIINQDPVLSESLDLPKQGEGIAKYGELISSNERYRNAFINTINLIAATVIKRNKWDNPWLAFTHKGKIKYGQQVREIINDLCAVYDYNENVDKKEEFLATETPNIRQYIHSVNFQKFYKVTSSDEEMSMAFQEGDLFSYIDSIVESMADSLAYDTYIVDKYMLCRRILLGTVPSTQIKEYATKTIREILSDMKSVSNKMIFKKPNYNPAAIRRATKFEEQYLILNTDFDARMSTEVLATSFFRDDAAMKSNSALIDGFNDHDTERLKDVLGKDYVAFTEEELTKLSKVPAVLIAKDFFMDYDYEFNNASGEKYTEFYNPQTLENNHFLHKWAIFSTSPFANCTVFTQDDITASALTVSPSAATVLQGQELRLSAAVTTTGFANQAVVWSVAGAASPATRINQEGKLVIGADESALTLTVTAKSVYNSKTTGTSTITVQKKM